jgi:hypothetical protein
MNEIVNRENKTVMICLHHSIKDTSIVQLAQDRMLELSASYQLE